MKVIKPTAKTTEALCDELQQVAHGCDVYRLHGSDDLRDLGPSAIRFHDRPDLCLQRRDVHGVAGCSPETRSLTIQRRRGRRRARASP